MDSEIEQKIKTLTQAQLGYLAGMVDGDGGISIWWSHTSNVMGISIYITNTNKKMLMIVKEWLGGGILNRSVLPIRNRKQCYTWSLRGGFFCSARALIAAVKPFLLIKRRQAEVAIRFFDRNRNTIIRKQELMYSLTKVNKITPEKEIQKLREELEKLSSYEFDREQKKLDLFDFYLARDLNKKGDENYQYVPDKDCPLDSPKAGDEFEYKGKRWGVCRVDILEGIVFADDGKSGNTRFRLRNWVAPTKEKLQELRILEGLKEFGMEEAHQKVVEPELPVHTCSKYVDLSDKDKWNFLLFPPYQDPNDPRRFEVDVPGGLPKPKPIIDWKKSDISGEKFIRVENEDVETSYSLEQLINAKQTQRQKEDKKAKKEWENEQLKKKQLKEKKDERKADRERQNAEGPLDGA